MISFSKQLKNGYIIEDRYIVSKFLGFYDNAEVYDIKDTRLDISVTMLRYSGRKTLPESEYSVLDFFSDNGCLLVLTDTDISSSIVNKSKTTSPNKMIVFGIPVLVLLIIGILFASRLGGSDISSENTSTPDSIASEQNDDNSSLDKTPQDIINTNGTSDSTALSDEKTEKMSFDNQNDLSYNEEKYLRIVLSPQEATDSQITESDIDILKKRFDALCGPDNYMFKLIDTDTNPQILVLVPKDLFLNSENLSYICKYFLACSFDIFAKNDSYDEANELYYPNLLSLNNNDIYTSEVVFDTIPGFDYIDYLIQNNIIADKDESPYKDQYPFVALSVAESFKGDHIIDNKPYVTKCSDGHFRLGEVIDNDKLYVFKMMDYADDSYSIFVPSLYSFNNTSLTEACLNLLAADFKLGKLSCNYDYNVTTSDIIWESRENSQTFGGNQCDINELDPNSMSSEVVYLDYSISEYLSAGNVLDLAIFLHERMDSLNTPYAIGERLDNLGILHKYIALPADHAGIPVLEMVPMSKSNFYNLKVYNGMDYLEYDNNKIFSSIVFNEENRTLSLSILDEHKFMLKDYTEEMLKAGHNTLYLSAYDNIILRSEISAPITDGKIVFDALALDTDYTEDMWTFIENLINASKSPVDMTACGIEILPSGKNIHEIAKDFGYDIPRINENTANEFNNLSPLYKLSYAEELNGNRYLADPGYIHIDMNLILEDPEDDPLNEEYKKNLPYNFATKSINDIKRIYNVLGFEENQMFTYISFNILDNSLTADEHSSIALFKIGNHFDPSLDSDFDILNYSAPKIDFMASPMLLSLAYGRVPSGIYSAGYICNGRIHKYKGDYKDILSKDSFLNPDYVDKTWLWSSYDNFSVRTMNLLD